MKKIDRILQYLEKEGIKTSNFERKAGLGNSYFNNISKRGEDITAKMLDRIRKNASDDYYKIFREEKISNKEYDKNESTAKVNDDETNSYEALLKLADSTKAAADALLINVRNAERLILMLEKKQDSETDPSKASA